jgi:hypothetical protein
MTVLRITLQFQCQKNFLLLTVVKFWESVYAFNSAGAEFLVTWFGI